MRKIQFTETVLRDGQQSQIATRMQTSEMLPILTEMDNAGYRALEVWGGATFDACLRYLNEDPWERLQEIRKRVKKTKLQMLLRGQNLLGYKNYADDVVKAFIQKSLENGIDVIRVFDALNDVRNLEVSMRAIKEFGGECQAALSYTTSPIHTLEYFVNLAVTLEAMGADSLCIKDMAGVLTPGAAFDLVKRIKERTTIPLEIHTHATCGTSEMVYLKAVEAGVDCIDTCISSFSSGTSQPATESLAVSLADLGYETNLSMARLTEMATYFDQIRDRYRKEGILNAKVKDISPKALVYQVPGGMLSNLLSQLEAQGLAAHFDEVLAEVPKVRQDLGYPPLVTPLSQMVGTQALMNSLTGVRYQMIPNEIKDYVAGLYGTPPGEIAPEIRQLIIGDRKTVTERPADLLAPQLPTFWRAAEPYAKTLEDVLIYGMFPQIGKDFLGRREDRFYDVPTQEIFVTLDIQ